MPTLQFWHQKWHLRHPKMTFSEPFWRPWVVGGVIWAPRWRPKANSKSFQKLTEFPVIFGLFGGRVPLPPAGFPGQHKTHIFSKSKDFAAEGCEFSISGFRYPLRIVTFSDLFWAVALPLLYWFLWCVTGRIARQQGNHTPTTCTEARWRIYIYIYIL